MESHNKLWSLYFISIREIPVYIVCFLSLLFIACSKDKLNNDSKDGYGQAKEAVLTEGDSNNLTFITYKNNRLNCSNLFIDSRGNKWLGCTDRILRYNGTWFEYTIGCRNNGEICSKINRNGDNFVFQTEDHQGSIFFIGDKSHFSNDEIIKYSDGIFTTYITPFSYQIDRVFFNKNDQYLYFWITDFSQEKLYKIRPSADLSRFENYILVYDDPQGLVGFIYYDYGRGSEVHLGFNPADNIFYITLNYQITTIDTEGKVLGKKLYSDFSLGFNSMSINYKGEVYVGHWVSRNQGLYEILPLIKDATVKSSPFSYIPYGKNVTKVGHMTIDRKGVPYLTIIPKGEFRYYISKLSAGKLTYYKTAESLYSYIEVDNNNVKWAISETGLLRLDD